MAPKTDNEYFPQYGSHICRKLAAFVKWLHIHFASLATLFHLDFCPFGGWMPPSLSLSFFLLPLPHHFFVLHWKSQRWSQPASNWGAQGGPLMPPYLHETPQLSLITLCIFFIALITTWHFVEDLCTYSFITYLSPLQVPLGGVGWGSRVGSKMCLYVSAFLGPAQSQNEQMLND